MFGYSCAVIFGIFGANMEKVGTSDIAAFTLRKDLFVHRGPLRIQMKFLFIISANFNVLLCQDVLLIFTVS
jgi:hypothetical protein